MGIVLRRSVLDDHLRYSHRYWDDREYCTFVIPGKRYGAFYTLTIPELPRKGYWVPEPRVKDIGIEISLFNSNGNVFRYIGKQMYRWEANDFKEKTSYKIPKGFLENFKPR